VLGAVVGDFEGRMHRLHRIAQRKNTDSDPSKPAPASIDTFCVVDDLGPEILVLLQQVDFLEPINNSGDVDKPIVKEEFSKQKLERHENDFSGVL
jgi:hypothetical protein